MPELSGSIAIDDLEFQQFQRLLFEQTGIHLAVNKKPLLTGRLNQRLRQLDIPSYAVYYRAIVSGKLPGELQEVIDRLTTNETSFFREPKHFDFLRGLCQTPAFRHNPVRIWCAASSSGEEPYTIAMVMADAMTHERWEIVASDVNIDVLRQARAGHYSMQRGASIPKTFLHRYCLKGTGEQAGTFVIGPELRAHLQFQRINLNVELPVLGQFDVIFLRNTLIYFPQEVKQRIVGNMQRFLKKNGHFIVGHSETLMHVVDELHAISPSIYRRA